MRKISGWILPALLGSLLGQGHAQPVPRNHAGAWVQAVRQAQISPAIWRQSMFYGANLRLDNDERIKAFGFLLGELNPDFIELKEPVEKKAGALRALLEREVQTLNENAGLGIGDLETANKLLAAQKILPELEEDKDKKKKIEQSIQKIRDRIAQIVIDGQKALTTPAQQPDTLSESPAVQAKKPRLQKALEKILRTNPAPGPDGRRVYSQTMERQGLATETFTLHHLTAGGSVSQGYIEIAEDLKKFGKHVFRFSIGGNGELFEALYISPDGTVLRRKLEPKDAVLIYEKLAFWINRILAE